MTVVTSGLSAIISRILPVTNDDRNCDNEENGDGAERPSFGRIGIGTREPTTRAKRPMMKYLARGNWWG